jgi:hypothetical protein
MNTLRIADTIPPASEATRGPLCKHLHGHTGERFDQRCGRLTGSPVDRDADIDVPVSAAVLRPPLSAVAWEEPLPSHLPSLVDTCAQTRPHAARLGATPRQSSPAHTQSRSPRVPCARRPAHPAGTPPPSPPPLHVASSQVPNTRNRIGKCSTRGQTGGAASRKQMPPVSHTSAMNWHDLGEALDGVELAIQRAERFTSEQLTRSHTKSGRLLDATTSTNRSTRQSGRMGRLVQSPRARSTVA